MTKEQQNVWNGLNSYLNKKLAVKKAKSGGGGTSSKSSDELKILRTHVKNVDKLVQKTKPATPERTKAVESAISSLRKKVSKVIEKKDEEIDYNIAVGLLKASAELASYLPKPESNRKKSENKSSENTNPPAK